MKKLILALLLCLIPQMGHATATERGFTIEYTEPVFSACGHSTQLKPTSSHGGSNQSAGGDCVLDDLAGTKIYMDVIDDGVNGTVDTVAATAKTGGGKISKKYCVPILDDATALTIEIEVTAFDENGNESPKTPKIIHPVPGTRDCRTPDTTPHAGVENFSIK